MKYTVLVYLHNRTADGAKEKTEIFLTEAKTPLCAEDTVLEHFEDQDPEILAVFEGHQESLD